MLKNNNCSSSYAKVRANKSLSIQNSGCSSNGSHYKDISSFNQNKSSSISSRNSQDSSNRNKFISNNQHQTIQEDHFNNLNRNLDFSQINLKNQQKQLNYGHNASVYSQENKENYNLNYSNLVNNQSSLNQQQETFRKINQNSQQAQHSSIVQPSKQKQNITQSKNIYQQIMSNNFNSVAKKNKQSSSNLQAQQQRQSLDLSTKHNDGFQDLQKKRSESTYSNYSLDSSNNQSFLMASSKNQNNISNSNSIQLNNWLQNNQLIQLDNMKQAPDSSSCINISHLLNQNISQSNISINESSNFISISPAGLSQCAHKTKQALSFNENPYINNNNSHNQINESQNHLISRQINSVQNSKNNCNQAQQLNQKQIISSNNSQVKQNNNQKAYQKIQISADSNNQLQTFSSSENNNQINNNNNNNCEVSYQNNNFCASQSNPSTGNTIENLTLIQKSNELNQLKKDLRQSNNELMQYKNRLKTIEQENKNLKQQFEQDKQQKHHLEEYIQKIKGLQFIVAQEKRISSRIIQENLQRNESISLILTNLVSIIQIIQQKIETPKASYEKILSQISQNLNPILLCLNPIIQDINNYNQNIVQQVQNQHESRFDPIHQMNKQPSQKGKKVLTIKGTQEQQQYQRNGSNNKLNNNHNFKKRGIQLEEPTNILRQKKQQNSQIQSSNSLGRSQSSINVKQQQQKISLQQQNRSNKLNDDQFEQISNGTQHLLKQSFSSINLQTQSLHIPQLGEQNENEIEAIINKQLLNHNNNPLQQIQLKQNIQDQKNSIQTNKQKNQQISLNECQRINTKESMDSFYQQCLLNNSLRISESSRSITANNGVNQLHSQEHISQNIQQLANVNQSAQQIKQQYNQVTSHQKEQFNFIDSYPLQQENIFGQFTECSTNQAGLNKISSVGGSFFDSKSSQIENYSSNHMHRNSLESQRNNNIPYVSQELTGSFSTQQNQNYLVGTFSQLPQDCSSKMNVDSNYQSGSSDPFNQEIIKNRRNSNPFKVSNYNSNSSNYNQSQKLFSDTLKGLGETLKNLQSDENQNFCQLKNADQEVQIKSKSTFRSNDDQYSEYQNQQQSQMKDQTNEEISSVNDRLSQVGTEKSSTQLEIENLKKKIMQRQSRRKLQNAHNTSVQEISHNLNSQREMSAPPKDSLPIH
ncbi:hypothetical protein TTHERM_00312270 (macronuclear) [Tetrahymena thermophila SB210]|uniref:Uncharacterized protein n=1 Tax=Tetrahymena thermophila (strain SB210) TaxID=312017 RepID=Q22KQ4_TETTS|nr:hypothetical protein TTHERM_00312270 [Tetrahymena thermophila SB210]EAR85745.1 hypothetical protein TTHERM_00312270 [Tetrahymena thermophila SB210]|eukprot:XP_001033408.1 hypothetical protein TTHERM_00312270 [Tetrahymena thermophila SB210]